MCVIVPIVYHRNPWGFISEECQPHPPARRMKMRHMLALMQPLKGECGRWVLGNKGAETLMPLLPHTGSGDGGGAGG